MTIIDKIKLAESCGLEVDSVEYTGTEKAWAAFHERLEAEKF